MAIINLNFAPLLQNVRSAWLDTSRVMGKEFQAVITEPIHPWPRGESPRDIVDTGALRDSQIMALITPYETKYLYPVDYSGYVQDGTSRMPGRNWGQIALARKPLLDVFAESMRAYS
jgi:hypothetical protein